MVSAGCSSISQWPEFAIKTSVTLSAALRMMMATFAPNAFAAPIASTGMVSLVVIETLLSSASLGIERNWAKVECPAPAHPSPPAGRFYRGNGRHRHMQPLRQCHAQRPPHDRYRVQ